MSHRVQQLYPRTRFSTRPSTGFIRRSVSGRCPAAAWTFPLAYLQWIVLMLLGFAAGLAVSWPFALAVFALWCMGCVYNIPPVRTKDKPFLDVLSESVNNPLRLLSGWYIVGASVVPSAACF